MKNKILTILIAVISVLGLILSLIQLYAPAEGMPLLIEGSYYYLGTTFILFVLSILIEKPINKTLKFMTTIVLTLFGIFGYILSLILLYASPLNDPEPYIAAIFFLAGMLGGTIIPMIKVEKSQEKIEIGKIHKAVRIIVLILIVLILVRLVIKLIPILTF